MKIAKDNKNIQLPVFPNLKEKTQIHVLEGGVLKEAYFKCYAMRGDIPFIVYVTSESKDCNEARFENTYKAIYLFKQGKSIADSESCTIVNIPCNKFLNDDGSMFKKTFFSVENELMEEFEAYTVYYDKDGLPCCFDVPENFFSSKEECIKWNDIRCEDITGETHLLKSKYKRAFALEEKQKELIEKMKSLFIEMKQSGLKIFFDNNNYRLVFLNNKDLNIESITSDNTTGDEDLLELDASVESRISELIFQDYVQWYDGYDDLIDIDFKE